MDDRYLTIRREARAELKVKGSRFIGEALKADSPPDANDRLEEIRKREHAATHHCYAWITGLFNEQELKYSDDGEPSGTAGKPIYDVISGAELTDCLVVVTRYFGGTKLGTGGLVRAYSDAAKSVLQAAGLQERFLYDRFHIEIDFSHYDQLLRSLNQLEAKVQDSQFTDSVALEVDVRKSRADRLPGIVTELTAGKGVVSKTDG